jgi:hypothetical protein
LTDAGVWTMRPSFMAQLRMPLIASPKAADPMLCAPLLYESRFRGAGMHKYA